MHPREKLKPLSLRALGPGRHADGEGLYMLVDPTGGRRWLLRTLVHGRRVDIGLGTVRFGPDELARVRERSRTLRDVARSGGDPLAERRAEREARRAETARRKTFKDYATDYIETQKLGWKNVKHAAQWTATLTAYVYPVFGDTVLDKVDRKLVLAALKPIWTTKPETASRVRGRIEMILDAAKASEYRTGDNPAAWADSLQTSLPRSNKKKLLVHHAALPYADLGAFMAALAAQPGLAAGALRLAILTAARTTEVIEATWDEIDFAERIWIIPAARMKAEKEHRIPLSPAALELLASLPRTSEFLFPGQSKKGERPISNMAMLAVLKRMKRTDITVHGFRSTFRDWAGETTAYPREVIEHALAHHLADKAEAAYQRGDLLRKRRALMEEWASFTAIVSPAVT